MKKAILLAAIILSTATFAQKKKSGKALPPPIKKPFILVDPVEKSSKIKEGQKLNTAAQILFKMEDASFGWKMTGMKKLVKDSVYEKVFTINSIDHVLFTDSFAWSDLQLPLPEGERYSLNQTMFLCSAKVKGDQIIIYDFKNDLKGTFQIILNKNKTKVMHLKDLKTGDLFLPTKATPPPPMM